MPELHPCRLSLPSCRDLSLADGHCFKNLIVGKTNTLNYYQPMNFTANTTVCVGVPLWEHDLKHG